MPKAWTAAFRAIRGIYMEFGIDGAGGKNKKLDKSCCKPKMLSIFQSQDRVLLSSIRLVLR